jgi:hypothetical protein
LIPCFKSFWGKLRLLTEHVLEPGRARRSRDIAIERSLTHSGTSKGMMALECFLHVHPHGTHVFDLADPDISVSAAERHAAAQRCKAALHGVVRYMYLLH